MRRDNKYGTNKTLRFCQKHLQTSLYRFTVEQLSINKNNRWKLLDLLKNYTESSDHSNKIVIRRNYKFHHYNGYKNELRENPPRHGSFARRPDFVYQPYVNFIKVNQDMFDLVFRRGWKFSQSKDNIDRLFDVGPTSLSVTLVYFIDDSKHCYSSDWIHAWNHAFGGSFAGYHSHCWGDYCPLGPKIRGQQQLDSRINQVLFILKQNNKRDRSYKHSCGYWQCSIGSDPGENKRRRSAVKNQRRNKHILTKQIGTTQNSY